MPLLTPDQLNPLASLPGAVMKGLEMRQMMQSAADRHQEFQQRQANAAHDASVKSIMDRMNLEMSGARPVQNGMVTDSMANAPAPDAQSAPPAQPAAAAPAQPNSQPSLPLQQLSSGDGPGNAYPVSLDALRSAVEPAQPGPQQPAPQPAAAPAPGPYLRKADQSRVVTVPNPDGSKTQYELLKPEEQMQRQAQMQEASVMREKMGLAKADTAVRQFYLKMRGQKLDDATAKTLGIDNTNPSNLFLPDEIANMAGKAAEVRKGQLHDVAPGAGIVDTTQLGQPPAQGAAPGAPAAGGASPMVFQQPLKPEGEFEKDYLPAVEAKLGRPLTPDEKLQAVTDFTVAKKDPEQREQLAAMRGITEALGKMKLGQGQAFGDPNAPPSATAKAVADYRTPYSQAVARLPGAQRDQMLQQVMAVNPDFHAEYYDNFNKTEKDATTGKIGTTSNALNTMVGHLAVLNKAADALKNNDVQALNKLANFFGAQTGSTPITVYNTIVHRLAPEVTKAYIAGGGSVGERGTNESDFDAKLGPDQIKQNIGVSALLADSKLKANQEQYNRGTYGRGKQQLLSPESETARQQLVQQAPPNLRGSAPPMPATLSASDVGKVYLSKGGQTLKITAVNPNDGTQFQSQVQK
jgi:hypothetical protein